MHELAVTQSLMDIVVHHAESAGAAGVADVYLVIGQLSSFVDDSVQFYWDILSKDTLAEGARLHFRRLPATASCHDCLQRYPLHGNDFACPNCRGVNIQILSGDEFHVEAIDVNMAEQKEASL
jgi:hydrogenase nickel incorporation protein HypA/HybF